MKYCANCKKAFSDDSYKVCPHCGGELESVEIEKNKTNDSAVAESKDATINTNTPAPDDRQKIESRGLAGFLLMAAGIALIIGSIVIWNLSSNKDLREYSKMGYGNRTIEGTHAFTGSIYVKTVDDALMTNCYIPVIAMPIGAVVCLWIGSGLFKPYLDLKDGNKDNNNESQQ